MSGTKDSGDAMEALQLAYQNRKPLPLSPRIPPTIITNRLLLWLRGSIA